MTDTDPWHAAPLVALDLEGSGAQDGDDEAILEIAAVPLVDGCPSLVDAYASLVNPGRPVPRRPWISPQRLDDHVSVVDCLQHRLEVGDAKVGEDRLGDWREGGPPVQARVVEVAPQIDGGAGPSRRPVSEASTARLTSCVYTPA